MQGSGQSGEESGECDNFGVVTNKFGTFNVDFWDEQCTFSAQIKGIDYDDPGENNVAEPKGFLDFMDTEKAPAFILAE